MATNPPAAVSNMVLKKTGLSINVPDKNDPVEKEFQKLMSDDDAAQEFTPFVNPVGNFAFGSEPSPGGAISPFATGTVGKSHGRS